MQVHRPYIWIITHTSILLHRFYSLTVIDTPFQQSGWPDSKGEFSEFVPEHDSRGWHLGENQTSLWFEDWPPVFPDPAPPCTPIHMYVDTRLHIQTLPTAVIWPPLRSEVCTPGAQCVFWRPTWRRGHGGPFGQKIPRFWVPEAWS